MATANLFETFFDCVESGETQVVRYRKDLSYAPAAPWCAESWQSGRQRAGIFSKRWLSGRFVSDRQAY